MWRVVRKSKQETPSQPGNIGGFLTVCHRSCATSRKAKRHIDICNKPQNFKK